VYVHDGYTYVGEESSPLLVSGVTRLDETGQRQYLTLPLPLKRLGKYRVSLVGIKGASVSVFVRVYCNDDTVCGAGLSCSSKPEDNYWRAAVAVDASRARLTIGGRRTRR
jgi:hypothetical protein